MTSHSDLEAELLALKQQNERLREALSDLHRDWLQLSRSGDGCELGKRVRAALAADQSEGKA